MLLVILPSKNIPYFHQNSYYYFYLKTTVIIKEIKLNDRNIYYSFKTVTVIVVAMIFNTEIGLPWYIIIKNKGAQKY